MTIPELQIFERAHPGDSVIVKTADRNIEGILVEVRFDRFLIACDKGIVTLRLSDALSIEHRTRPLDRTPEVESRVASGREAWQRRTQLVASIRREPQVWAEIRTGVLAEFAYLKSLSRTQRKAYLQQVGAEITEKIKRRFGISNIGFHYNMHGGSPTQFTDFGGLRAGMPNIPGQFQRDHIAMLSNRRAEVYFYQSNYHNLAQVVGAYHQDIPFVPWFRMGDTFVMINLDVVQGPWVRNGLVKQQTVECVEFDRDKLLAQPYNRGVEDPEKAIGIPYSLFLTPPVSVFQNLPGKLELDRQLSWDETTLATMRFIERFSLTAPLPPQIMENEIRSSKRQLFYS